MKLMDLVKEETGYKIYCDMDGVLSDFSSDFLALTKKYKVELEEGDGLPDNAAARWERKHGTEAFWKIVERGGLNFWSDMSWQSGGKKLWSYIKKYNPSILSAPSKRSYANCVKGKKMWVSSRLGNPEIIFRSKEKKREFAKKNSILIDDLKYNIRDWKSSGGIAIHHTNVNKTIAELKELGL